LLVFSVKDNKADDHPERRRKALYAEYYSIQLPIIKEEQPGYMFTHSFIVTPTHLYSHVPTGLKLSQYKERIFEMWKAAPENPENQKKSNVFKWSAGDQVEEGPPDA